MKNKIFKAYIGTYTTEESEGIYSIELNSDSGIISEIKLEVIIENPTYLSLSKDNKYLYSIIKKDNFGGIAIFRNNVSGLNMIDYKVNEGKPPCFIKNIFEDVIVTANYHTFKIEEYFLSNQDKRIEDFHSIPNNLNHNLQSHPHYVDIRDDKFLEVIDLGMDQISIYDVSKDNKLRTIKEVINLKSGCGPRHMVKSKDDKYAYVLTEKTSEIIILKYLKDGKYEVVKYLKTLPDNVKNSFGGAIHISKDGEYIYISHRGYDSIMSFKIDYENENLIFIDNCKLNGSYPRDFSLDPEEKFIIVCNEKSNNIELLENKKGKLKNLNKKIFCSKPVCVKFLNY
ncbi:6-phosphogluconolactonase [Clostridium cavendishii DSM 21758]|uniref:6-phosphogluconolactonase n=1 Tax=Clostridium cavendishii DSM 21758 TaxID=1121302 RepID=A0A1M6PRW6_9CLOT|nr:lactonase family protein [Clostridium cavendishii]SHK10714.1 6-phosphogluconolactonase [Clostridium cavendishii DSM 21758]